MTQPVAGVPYAFTFTPKAEGVEYDPQPAGGTVDRLELLTLASPAVTAADVGPAVRASAARYRFPEVTLPAGSYDFRVTWTAATGALPRLTTGRVTVLELSGSLDSPSLAHLPSAQDIADVIPRRPNDDGLARAAFTADTVPTAAQADRIGLSYAVDVASRLGGQVPPAYNAQARRVAALGAAAQIELSFYPEGQDRSGTAQALFARYDAALTSLAALVENQTGVDLPGDPDNPTGDDVFTGTAMYAFDDDALLRAPGSEYVASRLYGYWPAVPDLTILPGGTYP